MRLRTLAGFAAAVAFGVTSAANAQYFTEGFDTVVPTGWTAQNNSNPLGTIGWFQGNSTVFPAHSGAATSYAGVNFNSGSQTATISNWLMTPQISVSAGDVVTFWSRTVNTPSFPDRLQLRFSPTGAASPGTTATDVGDFTLLLDINPTYTTAGYPNVWTQFTATIPQSAPNGRLAFRYFVENGGPNGSNSDYIGVDTFAITAVPEPTALGAIGIAGLTLLRRRRA